MESVVSRGEKRGVGTEQLMFPGVATQMLPTLQPQKLKTDTNTNIPDFILANTTPSSAGVVGIGADTAVGSGAAAAAIVNPPGGMVSHRAGLLTTDIAGELGAVDTSAAVTNNLSSGRVGAAERSTERDQVGIVSSHLRSRVAVTTPALLARPGSTYFLLSTTKASVADRNSGLDTKTKEERTRASTTCGCFRIQRYPYWGEPR